jgi:protein-L-isoaspartate(D-aspartate) O-methyltransferase
MSTRISGEHAALLSELRAGGITDQRVLDAMGSIDRSLFVSPALRSRAYEDIALPIACNQTISQPYTVAFMTQLLDVQRGMKVLEIGTGSGYQAAVLHAMGARVFTIERHADLLLEARTRFEQLGCNIASKVGDGSIGWSEFAPYDRIIVTAAAPRVPDALVKQLADGGILIVPVGERDGQTLVLVTRSGDQFQTLEYDSFKFVPLVGKEGFRE